MERNTLIFILKTTLDTWLIPSKYYILIILSILFYILTRYNCSVYIKSSNKDTYFQVPKQYCRKCNILKYYRMKHCKQCKKCIHKYDHHCYIMYVCIGEFNQKYYVLFLLFYLILQLLCLFVAFSSIKNQVQADDKGIEHYSFKFLIYTLSIFYSLSAITLCGVLLKTHLLYIYHNTTSWEHHSRQKITYLAIYPQFQKYPFDKGGITNINEAIFASKNSPIQWILPVPQQQKLLLNK